MNTQKVDISDLLKVKEFDTVKVALESQSDGPYLCIFHKMYNGFTVSDFVSADEEKLIIHLSRTYEPPRTREFPATGALPPPHLELNPLVQKRIYLGREIKTVKVGKDVWSISGVLHKEEKPYRIETNPELLLKYSFEAGETKIPVVYPEKVLNQIWKDISNGAYCSLNLLSKPEPWPPIRLNAIGIEYYSIKKDRWTTHMSV